MAVEAMDEVPASRLANAAAPVIAEAFDEYQQRFGELTRAAKSRFERREWRGMLADSSARLDLYSVIVKQVETRIRSLLGSRVEDKMVWAGMKAVFSSLVAERENRELTETFFNSLTRRIFATEGVDPNIEYIDSDFPEVAPAADFSGSHLVKRFGGTALEQAALTIVRDGWFEAPFESAERDGGLVADRLAEEMSDRGLESGSFEAIELLREPFFRRKGAYLVGRLITKQGWFPLALAVLNEDRGIVVDAVLCDVDDISIVFSFTRSHFHVDLGPIEELVHYLKMLMPRKPVAELYIALGHHKHGKTELYRDVLRRMRESEDRFDIAPGTPGMVMIVFTLPAPDVVFKLIRSSFPSIKLSTQSAIRDNYALVFRHDRAGRLVEAQEFEHLKFERRRFSDGLLAELERDGCGAVSVDGDEVVIHHAYVERRMTPLDVYLREASAAEAEAAVIDFGQAVKDLAANGIFPGELLPKNFGVTRHGRVVCYDYDELGLLTDFTFRSMPENTSPDDDLADEAWFGAGPRDLFPEEFRRFIGLAPHLLQVLDTHHSDLYDVRFWQELRGRVQGGEIIDIFPYPAGRRLRACPQAPGKQSAG